MNINTDKIPIIFIHYGDSAYLEYSLDLAKKKNPNKRVILLGDKTNKKYTKLDIEHFYFEDYFSGEEVEKFKKNYQFIAGDAKRKSYWTNFVFKRWFCIYNFINKNNIEKFWTFDSDTLILTSLLQFEEKFHDIDCTTQCNGICMNGFVNNQDVVKGYVNKINELFTREDYLNKQKEEMKENPRWAFTEMRAFKTYEEESVIKTKRLSEIIDSSTFDECICQDNDMEMEKKENYDYKTNKLYFKNGEIFEKNLKNGELIKLNTVNMSWVPTLFIAKVYYYGINGKKAPFYLPLLYGVKKMIRIIKRKTKQ